MPALSKALHYGIDLVLVSTFLAGVKRNTGLTPNLDSYSDSFVQEYGKKYLNFGESVYDMSVSFFSSSSYFKRT